MQRPDGRIYGRQCERCLESWACHTTRKNRELAPQLQSTQIKRTPRSAAPGDVLSWHDQEGSEGALRRTASLIFARSDFGLSCIPLKIIFPGTTRLISVPDSAELEIEILPPIRTARSCIPRKPKWPSLPISAMRMSMPVPLSLTRNERSCAKVS